MFKKVVTIIFMKNISMIFLNILKVILHLLSSPISVRPWRHHWPICTRAGGGTSPARTTDASVTGVVLVRAGDVYGQMSTEPRRFDADRLFAGSLIGILRHFTGFPERPQAQETGGMHFTLGAHLSC